MTIRMPARLARACLFAFALGTAAPLLAVPLMDMRAEDLLPMASEFRKSLNLNANQQTLWLQVESRSRAVLRERQHRREALQDKAKVLLARPDVELRELNAMTEAESAAASQEDRQLRELWLGVNDALDDGQRRQIAVFVGGHGRGGMGGMGGPGGVSIGG